MRGAVTVRACVILCCTDRQTFRPDFWLVRTQYTDADRLKTRHANRRECDCIGVGEEKK